MDSFERKGIMLAVGAHVALAGGMVAAFLFSKPVEAEEPPPVEVSIAGLGDALVAGAPDAELGGGGEETLTPPPEDEVVEEVAEPDPAPAPEPEPEPAPVVKPKPAPKPTPKPDTSAADKKKQADADKRRANEAERKRKAEAEAKRKSDTERKRQSEAERKKQSDAEKRRAAEAERKRKADAAEAERKRKANEAEQKRKTDAERKRKAEEERKRKAAEAERKRKAEEERKRKEEGDRASNFNPLGPKGGGNGGPSKSAAEVRQVANASIAGEVRPFLQACAPSGVGVSDLRVFVSLTLGKDGSLLGANVYDVKGVTASNRSQVEPMKRCALQAVRKAAPFKLDPDGYDVWRIHKIQLKPN